MAGDSESSKPVDKGKGKAVEDPKKEKPAVNGKKEDEKIIDGKHCRLTGLRNGGSLTCLQPPRSSAKKTSS